MTFSRGKRPRSRAVGRIITAGGGGPNQPIALMASTAIWTADGQDCGEYHWTLRPAMITPHWCRMLDGDARVIKRIADNDIDEWRESRNPTASAIVVSDIGQNLAAADILRGRDFHDPNAYHNVLINGSDNSGDTFGNQGTSVIGARYLVSWFDAVIWKNTERANEPPTGAHGAPFADGQIVLSHIPDQYTVPGDGGLTWDQVGRAAASTEDLVRRSGLGDSDTLTNVTADETVAIALMLQFWAADRFAPSANTGPINRGFVGVF